MLLKFEVLIRKSCIFRKWDLGAWTGLLWLRTGTGGGLV
jgi:hypothetical protein